MNKKIFISEDLPANTGGRMIVNRNMEIAKNLGYEIFFFKKEKGLFNSLSFIILGVPIKLIFKLLMENYTHMWFDRSTYLIAVIRKFIKPKTVIITYYQNNEFHFKKNIDKLKGDTFKRRLIRSVFWIKEFGQRKKSNLSIFINKTEMDRNNPNHIFLPPTFNTKIENNQKNKIPKIFLYYNEYLPNKIGFNWLEKDLKNSNFIIDIISRDQSKYNDLPSNINWQYNIPNLQEYLVKGSVLIAPLLDTNGFKMKIAEALAHGLIVITTSILYKNLIEQGIPSNNLVELKASNELDITIQKALLIEPNTKLYTDYFSLYYHTDALERIRKISY